MRRLLRSSLVSLGAVVLLSVGVTAFGADGINLSITNDGTDDIYVTVTDAATKVPLIAHMRLNGFSSLSVSAAADASGLASISWTAISVDDRDRHCGRGTQTGLDGNATVNVHADSSCQ